MSKLFIPTVNCGKAHEADIFDVAVCNPFTITCSGDGSIKLWKNKLLEGQQAKNKVDKQFVNKSGIHHIDVLHTVEKKGIEFCIIACAAFDSTISFYSVQLSPFSIKELDLLSSEDKKRSYWCVRWYKSDDRSVTHKFAATEVNGSIRVWKFHPFTQEINELKEGDRIEDGEFKNNEELNINPHFTSHGVYSLRNSKFPTSLDISNKDLVATGYSDGSVVVFQLSTLRPVYNFEGFGLQGTQDNSSTVRAVSFSPLGEMLAVANDSGSYGYITIYDTEYGEAVGNLTVPTHSNQKSIVSVSHNGWVFGLSFNSTGEYLASCGYDAKIRIWDVKLKEHVSTLNISAADIEDENDMLEVDEHGASLSHPPILGVTFVRKGVRGGIGAEVNEGLCCICLDRSVRWYREAGGI